MSKTYRIGLLGLTHDHVWENIKEAMALPNATLVGAADPNLPLLEKFQQVTGVGAVRTDYEALLDTVEMDGILAFGSNHVNCGLTELAASRGLHVMTEKPMAASLAQADRMLVAASKAGTILMVNWPTAWDPTICHALALAKEGAIGRIWQLKWRGGHAGPKEVGCTPYFYNWLYDGQENGAGVLFDYCGYGASMAIQFIGLPSEVMAIAGRLVKSYIPVDDNAIVALQYHNANAVIETSWSEPISHHPPHDLILYGTGGVMIARELGGVVIYSQAKPDGITYDPPALQAPTRNGPEYFVHCMETGTPPEGMCSAEASRRAQEIMEAALISARSGRRVALPLNDYLFRRHDCGCCGS